MPLRVDPIRALGVRVRQLRDGRDWTQERLAAEADIQRTYLAEVEAGKRNPTVKFLAKLAAALHVRIADLFLDN